MNDFALMITMDSEGRLFIEAVVPKEFCTPLDDERTEVRLPIPRPVIPTIARAMLDAVRQDDPKPRQN